MIHFNTKIIRTGEQYGLNDCLVNEGEAMVEFYDSRFTGEGFSPIGQFVTRYNISSLLADGDTLSARGLNLDAGIDSWSVDPKQMSEIIKSLRNV